MKKLFLVATATCLLITSSALAVETTKLKGGKIVTSVAIENCLIKSGKFVIAKTAGVANGFYVYDPSYNANTNPQGSLDWEVIPSTKDQTLYASLKDVVDRCEASAGATYVAKTN